MSVRFVVLLAACLFASVAAADERATDRFAPAQLAMARESLEHAREAALSGDRAGVGQWAWQASVDARLAWAMSDSAAVRVPAAAIVAEARQLVGQALAAAAQPGAALR